MNFREFQKKSMTRRLTHPGPPDSTITAQKRDPYRYPSASMSPMGVAQVQPPDEWSQVMVTLVGAACRR